ncbi:p53 and DNA damage-regulated protein 1-like [Rhopilema esculentum]|uniref:p53 and DNA damage-regulated protein 1-like n=1 Tax=Rhopilema esculentum TaxID=499914 RepID=UPI0031DE8844
MAARQAVDVREKTSKVLDRMSKIEALGEEVLTDKQQLVDLDRKKNKNREAINALKKTRNSNESKSWLCIGNTFFRFEDDLIANTLKEDQKELEKEIQSIRNGITGKVSDLHQLEGQKDVKGFSLASLSAEDLAFVKHDV